MGALWKDAFPENIMSLFFSPLTSYKPTCLPQVGGEFDLLLRILYLLELALHRLQLRPKFLRFLRTLGHRFLREEFAFAPRVGWQIDPFGHSSTNAALSALMGYDAQYNKKPNKKLRNRSKSINPGLSVLI